MNEELKRFFKSINYEPNSDCYNNCQVAKVVFITSKDQFEVYLKNK